MQRNLLSDIGTPRAAHVRRGALEHGGEAVGDAHRIGPEPERFVELHLGSDHHHPLGQLLAAFDLDAEMLVGWPVGAVPEMVDGIVAPFAGRDHAAINLQNEIEFTTMEGDLLLHSRRPRFVERDENCVRVLRDISAIDHAHSPFVTIS